MLGLGCAQRGIDHVNVVPIHSLHMPPIGFKALSNVLSEGQVSAAIDGNPVIVVQVDEFTKAKVPGKRGRFGGDPLHKVPVAHDGVSKMVNDQMSWPVKVMGQKSLGDRHPDAIAETLAKGTRRRLHSWCHAMLRMSGGSATPLAELLEFMREEVVPGRVKEAIQEHATMAR